MSRIKSKDSAPEIKTRMFLRDRKVRYRKHVSVLPGTPDIVVDKLKTVVQVQGCFWHHHEGCKRAKYPRTHVKFWRDKIDGNIFRDKINIDLLQISGWNVIEVWECEINKKRMPKKMYNLVKTYHGQN